MEEERCLEVIELAGEVFVARGEGCLTDGLRQSSIIWIQVMVDRLLEGQLRISFILLFIY